MIACNWLKAKELMEYHILITLWKFLKHQTPPQLMEEYEWTDDRKILVGTPRLQITSSYFKTRAAVSQNSLNSQLRNIDKISTFKKELILFVL